MKYGLLCFSIVPLLLSGVNLWAGSFGQEAVDNDQSKALVFGTYAMGGDELAAKQYQDGHSESVFAGSGVAVGVGFEYEPLDQFGMLAAVSYFYDLADTDNGDLYFKRFPIEILSYYRQGRHKLGAGLSYHVSPSFEGDEGDYSFSNAQGYIFQYGYKTLRGPEFGLKITAIEYSLNQSTSHLSSQLNGNSIGLFGAVAF